jgi:hypothetical protein
MTGIKIALVVIGTFLAAVLVVGLVFSNLRFFIWVGIIGLIVWGIYTLVTRPWRYS